MDSYAAFVASKSQLAGDHGFAPSHLPSFLYPFQAYLVDWALRGGRRAIFADCGLGKTPTQLVWADQVCRSLNGGVHSRAPLAGGWRSSAEGEKFGIGVARSTEPARIVVANYE